MRVVFDTNIVVSGMLWTGAPAQAMDKATEGAFTLVTSETLIAELQTTLSRSKFVKRRVASTTNNPITPFFEITL